MADCNYIINSKTLSKEQFLDYVKTLSQDEIASVTPLMKKKVGEFSSSHFDEKNILVHLRMNTRTDANGNKVLFLEEVQSDWGQKGKKEGFADQLTDTEKQEYYRLMSEKGKRELSDVESKIYTKLNDKSNSFHNKKTPQAPFVTDTNSWTKLGLKVALKEAVKQGADKIAWTTGEQQNDRYDLQKQVDFIDVFTNDDGTYHIIAVKGNNTISEEKSLKENQLEGLLGKDLTKKIIEDTKNHTHKEGEENLVKTYRGNDLSVGGKGMKGFYGSPTEKSLGIVGNVAKSLFKQEPKTTDIKVTEDKFVYDHHNTTIEETPKAYVLKDKDGNSLASFSKEVGSNYPPGQVRKQKLLEIARQNPDLREKVTGNSIQHSIDITPELKSQVSEGLPLFMRTKEGQVFGFQKGDKIYLDPSLMNADTPIHEVVGHYGMNIIDAMAKGGDEKAQAVIAKGFSLLQESEGKAVLDEIKANPAYSSLSNREKKMEALATIIGREGANMFAEGTAKNTFASKVKDFIKSFYDYIRTKVPTLKDKTIKQIAAMDNKEFIRAIIGDAFRGEIVDNKEDSPINLQSEQSPKEKAKQDLIKASSNIKNSYGVKQNTNGKEVFKKTPTEIIDAIQKVANINWYGENAQGNDNKSLSNNGKESNKKIWIPNRIKRIIQSSNISEEKISQSTLQEIFDNDKIPETVKQFFYTIAVLHEITNPSSEELQRIKQAVTKNGNPEIIVLDEPNLELVAGTTDTQLFINVSDPVERILRIENLGEYIDNVAQEELIHLVTNRLTTEKEYKDVYNEMSENEIDSVSNTYGIDKNDKIGIGAEYVRMYIQDKVFGIATEHTLLSQHPALLKILNKLLGFVRDLVKNNPNKKISELAKRFENAVNGIDNNIDYGTSNAVLETSNNALSELATEINDLFNEGLDKTEIREVLIDSGYDEAEIDKELALFNEGEAPENLPYDDIRKYKGKSDGEIVESILNREIRAEEYPSILNLENEFVKKQQTAKTTENIEGREVDGQHITASLTSLKAISLQNVLVLKSVLGDKWMDKVLTQLERKKYLGNSAQVIGIMNIMSTEINQDLQSTENAKDANKLKKLQRRVDSVANTRLREASLTLNMKRLMRQFANGGDIKQAIADTILSKEQIEFANSIEQEMASTPNDADLNKSDGSLSSGKKSSRSGSSQKSTKEPLVSEKEARSVVEDKANTAGIREDENGNRVKKSAKELFNDAFNKINNIKGCK